MTVCLGTRVNAQLRNFVWSLPGHCCSQTSLINRHLSELMPSSGTTAQASGPNLFKTFRYDQGLGRCVEGNGTLGGSAVCTCKGMSGLVCVLAKLTCLRRSKNSLPP